MALRLMMDVHVRRQISVGLRLRGIDVLTAQADGSQRFTDSELLDRATQLGRVLFSQDSDLLAEARLTQSARIDFAGVIFAAQLGITVGQAVRDLDLVATVYDPVDMVNRVEFLPLK